MKKLLCFLMSIVLILTLGACGKGKDPTDDTSSSDRKHASQGQDTTTSSGGSIDTNLNTGVLSAVEKSMAKSNKAGIVYDPNVFIDLENDTSGKVRIAIVGDNITTGTTYTSNPEKKSWPALFDGMLKKKFSSRYSVTNYALDDAYVADFGQSTVATLRYQNTKEFMQLKKDKPDAVIVMLGTNDIANLTDKQKLADFTDDYKELIKAIKSLESKPIVYVCTPIIRTTAYSSYIAMDTLRDAAIEAANACGTYVIDTYSITKEYFESYLYETDGLNLDDTGSEYLAKTVFDGVVSGLTAYKAAKVSSTPDYVVYVDAAKGSYSSVGATANNPTSSFARAIALCKGGGTVVVCGPVTPATTRQNVVRTMVAPKNSGKITVTSIDPYDGTDYRTTNNAVIYMSGSMYLNGDYEFRGVNFTSVASGVKLACNYHNVTFGTGITCTNVSGGYFLIICGHDVVSVWQTEKDLSCTSDCTINFNGGTFSYFRGGNYRAYTTAASPYSYGTVKSGVKLTINIAGTTFANNDSATNLNVANSRLSSIVGANGVEKGAVVNCNISGGTINGSLFAVSRMNPYKSGSIPTIAGEVNLNISGGLLGGSHIDFLQTYPGATNPKGTGAYNLTITGGTFTAGGSRSISAKGSGSATLNLNSSTAYLLNWANITGFSKINQ